MKGLNNHGRELQAALPILFIAGERVLRLRAVRAVSSQMPSNVQVWRERSSWNSAHLTQKILDLIAATADAVSGPTDQLVLVMDCSAIHICRRVLQKARNLGIWILLVPAGCTHLFQPADTHCFSGYKSCLRQELSATQTQTNGVVRQEDWLRCLCKVSTEYMSAKSWLPAFARTGIVGSRADLSTKLREHCQQQETSLPPTFDELLAILPKAAQVWYWDVFGDLLGDHF